MTRTGARRLEEMNIPGMAQESQPLARREQEDRLAVFFVSFRDFLWPSALPVRRRLGGGGSALSPVLSEASGKICPLSPQEPCYVIPKLNRFATVSLPFLNSLFATQGFSTTCKVKPRHQRNSWLTPKVAAASRRGPPSLVPSAVALAEVEAPDRSPPIEVSASH